mmetsp:Transcript_8375/g.13218  ORF Transcript_8375/g.13218 Transcript_8375/m.13218 type:complete len:91 (+) Transcript_8375:660-932(+)
MTLQYLTCLLKKPNASHEANLQGLRLKLSECTGSSQAVCDKLQLGTPASTDLKIEGAQILTILLQADLRKDQKPMDEHNVPATREVNRLN